MTNKPVPPKVRLDKWLWAARFFKTRALASAAIHGGKIQIGGVRAKAARQVAVGDELHIRRGVEEFVVIVQVLSEKRGPYREACALYLETEKSHQTRVHQADLRRLQATSQPPPTKPTKQQRRKLQRLMRDSH